MPTRICSNTAKVPPSRNARRTSVNTAALSGMFIPTWTIIAASKAAVHAEVIPGGHPEPHQIGQPDPRRQ